MKLVENVLSSEIISQIHARPEVQTAYQKLAKQDSVYFSIPLTTEISNALYNSFQLRLTSLQNIPCRWIKGDTAPHIDRGQRHFEDTYLVYLTDSVGTFRIEDESYPIEAGTGFSFSEGLEHEVVGSQDSSRLLLGPMSEFGFAVGAGSMLSGAGGTYVYLRDNDGTVEYSYDQSSWLTISFPCGVENTNTSAGYFQVVFLTDLTLSYTNDYFYVQSEKIQFGSTSIKSDGTRPIITISVDSYPGLIENGTSATSGFNDIRVYNLFVEGTGHNTSTGGGWIGRGYFGNAATGGYFINCSSGGTVAQDGGGIVGYYTGSSGGSVILLGCSSSGTLGVGAGGITGANCDNITCSQCFSEGSIGQNAGGILGLSAGGSCSVTKCYSTGNMGLGAGGIIGASAVDGVNASQCYSTGTIGTSAGGIFGNYAATTTATNCYSTGTIGTSAGGIFGNPFGNPGIRTETNCYAANSSWNDSTANTNLIGEPTSSPGVGDTWASLSINTPYELVGFGVTPYQTQTINGTSLVQSYSQSVTQGSSSNEALNADASGNAFSILKFTGGDSGSYDTISISGQTGAISTSSTTVVGTYTLTVRSTGSYYITTFVLTVSADASSETTTTTACCVSTMDQRGLDYEQIVDYRIGNRLLLEVSQNSKTKFDGYSQYVKYKMAQGSRKV